MKVFGQFIQHLPNLKWILQPIVNPDIGRGETFKTSVMSCEDNVVGQHGTVLVVQLISHQEWKYYVLIFTVYWLWNRNRLKYLFWICKKYNYYRVIKYVI